MAGSSEGRAPRESPRNSPATTSHRPAFSGMRIARQIAIRARETMACPQNTATSQTSARMSAIGTPLPSPKAMTTAMNTVRDPSGKNLFRTDRRITAWARKETPANTTTAA